MNIILSLAFAISRPCPALASHFSGFELENFEVRRFSVGRSTLLVGKSDPADDIPVFGVAWWRA